MLISKPMATRRALEKGARLPAVWVTLFFVSSFRLTGSRDPSLASAGVASIENLIELAFYGFVGLLVVPYLPKIRRQISVPTVNLLVVYGTFAMISAAWSKIPLFSLVRGGQVLILALVVYATVQIWYKDQERAFTDWRRIWIWYVIVSAAVTLIGLAVGTGDRFAWPGQHPISSAAFLTVASLVSAALALDAKGRQLRARSRYFAAGSIFFGVAVFLTVTRSAMFSFLVALLVLILLTRKLRGSDRVFLTLCLVGMLVSIILIWPGETLGFVLRGGDVETLTTLTGRTFLWGHAIDAISESPIVGFGFGASRLVLLQRVPWAGEGHNLWIEAGVGLGLVGVVAITWILARLLSMAWRSRTRNDPDADLVGAFGVLMVIYGVAASSIARPGLLLTIASLVIAWLSVAETGAFGLVASSVDLSNPPESK